jgi:hypothetical protein
MGVEKDLLPSMLIVGIFYSKLAVLRLVIGVAGASSGNPFGFILLSMDV